jgi:hypothetical protein
MMDQGRPVRWARKRYSSLSAGLRMNARRVPSGDQTCAPSVSTLGAMNFTARAATSYTPTKA